jgi:hypothetical protein
VKLIGRVDLFGQAENRVFKGQERARVDVEGQVEIDGPAAALLGCRSTSQAWRSE